MADQWPYSARYLVFSGGGVCGTAYLGAWTVLVLEFKKQGIALYDQLDGFAGASIGALFSLLLAVHPSQEDLWSYVTHADFRKVVQDMEINSLFQTYGLNNKASQIKWLKHILKKETGDENTTFKQLYDMTGKTLVISVSCVNTAEVEYHSHKTVPNLPVWKSAIASMSIPVIFTPEEIEGKLYVDGGVFDNMPTVFDDAVTMYFHLDTVDTKQEIKGLKDYLYNIGMLQTIGINKKKRQQLTEKYGDHLITIPTNGVNPLDFMIPPSVSNLLVLYGAFAAYRYFNPDTTIDSISFLLGTVCTSTLDFA